MKVVRFAVLEDECGYAVWSVCPDYYRHGRCRFELWCSCVHSAGGPLESRFAMFGSLDAAVSAADALEAAEGGVRDVGDVSGVSDSPGLPALELDDGDVSY